MSTCLCDKDLDTQPDPGTVTFRVKCDKCGKLRCSTACAQVCSRSHVYLAILDAPDEESDVSVFDTSEKAIAYAKRLVLDWGSSSTVRECPAEGYLYRCSIDRGDTQLHQWTYVYVIEQEMNA